MDLSHVSIETPRLRLVPVSHRYAEDIFNEYSGDIVKYLNWPPLESIDLLKEKIDASQEQMRQGEKLQLSITLAETEEFLGTIALEDIGTQDPEFGAWIKKSAWGNQYGREAVKGLVEWAQKNISFDHLRWPCVAENFASRKTIESAGGVLAKEYVKTMANGKTWECVEYWIKKSI